MHGRTWIALALFTLLGCSELPEWSQPAPKQVTSSFNPSTTGAIHGRVVWDGDVPVAEPMLVKEIAFNPGLFRNPVSCTLPHYPVVHAENRGVVRALVFLPRISPQPSTSTNNPAF